MSAVPPSFYSDMSVMPLPQTPTRRLPHPSPPAIPEKVLTKIAFGSLCNKSNLTFLRLEVCAVCLWPLCNLVQPDRLLSSGLDW